MSQTLVIAEPGCTHEGRFEKIIELIETAATCGADVFKNQWMSDPDAVIARRGVPSDPYQRYYGWLAYPLGWHRRFKERCHELGMQYGCSVYLPKDVWPLEPYVDLFKISSFERKDLALSGTARLSGKRVIVSAGMLEETEYYMNEPDMLVCTSAYPAPLGALNLELLRMGRFAGLSDHSQYVLTGAVAVGAGADVVEAHMRLDDCDVWNPDYAVAFSPADFQQYIYNIRAAEQMMGTGRRGIHPSELPMVEYRVKG
jgi:N,N'-diacetyllegionaminate synthase